MIWLKELDPYVEVITNTSTAFLPIILKMPGLKTSIHVSIYLPTHGKDSEFVSDVADLRNCLDDLTRIHADAVIYIRGDSNVNPKNSMRVSLLQTTILTRKRQATILIIISLAMVCLTACWMYSCTPLAWTSVKKFPTFCAYMTFQVFCPTMTLFCQTLAYQLKISHKSLCPTLQLQR